MFEIVEKVKEGGGGACNLPHHFPFIVFALFAFLIAVDSEKGILICKL